MVLSQQLEQQQPLFAQALTTVPFPQPVIREDSLCIKITQVAYVKCVKSCKCNLRGKLMLNKGDKPYTTKDFIAKLSKQWKMLSFYRGYYEFCWCKP